MYTVCLVVRLIGTHDPSIRPMLFDSALQMLLIISDTFGSYEKHLSRLLSRTKSPASGQHVGNDLSRLGSMWHSYGMIHSRLGSMWHSYGMIHSRLS